MNTIKAAFKVLFWGLVIITTIGIIGLMMLNDMGFRWTYEL